MRSKVLAVSFIKLSLTQECLFSSSNRNLGVYTGVHYLCEICKSPSAFVSVHWQQKGKTVQLCELLQSLQMEGRGSQFLNNKHINKGTRIISIDGSPTANRHTQGIAEQLLDLDTTAWMESTSWSSHQASDTPKIWAHTAQALAIYLSSNEKLIQSTIKKMNHPLQLLVKMMRGNPAVMAL